MYFWKGFNSKRWNKQKLPKPLASVSWPETPGRNITVTSSVSWSKERFWNGTMLIGRPSGVSGGCAWSSGFALQRQNNAASCNLQAASKLKSEKNTMGDKPMKNMQALRMWDQYWAASSGRRHAESLILAVAARVCAKLWEVAKESFAGDSTFEKHRVKVRFKRAFSWHYHIIMTHTSHKNQ